MVKLAGQEWSSPRVHYRIFTLAEANAVLDQIVKPAFERLDLSREHLAHAEREADILGLIVDSGANPGSADQLRHSRLSRRIESIRAEISQEMAAIQATGALLKDLSHGLVDFFAVQDGQLVFLCWQRGEERIRFWHTVEDGFAGRRPLGERAELEE